MPKVTINYKQNFILTYWVDEKSISRWKVLVEVIWIVVILEKGQILFILIFKAAFCDSQWRVTAEWRIGEIAPFHATRKATWIWLEYVIVGSTRVDKNVVKVGRHLNTAVEHVGNIFV